MTDYAVKISVRNGRILRRMRECGFDSQAELARASDMDVQRLNQIVCMREKAYSAKGEWRPIAWDIATALQCEPEDLFNDQQRERALERNSAEVFMDAEQVQAITSGAGEGSTWAKIEAQRLLECLPNERMRRVVIERAEGATYDQIAEGFGVGRERIRQIELQAYRRMRGAAERSDKDCANKIIWGAN